FLYPPSRALPSLGVAQGLALSFGSSRPMRLKPLDLDVRFAPERLLPPSYRRQTRETLASVMTGSLPGAHGREAARKPQGLVCSQARRARPDPVSAPACRMPAGEKALSCNGDHID